MDNDITKVLNHLFRYLKTEKKKIIIIFILIIIITIIGLFPPLLMAQAVNNYIANKDLTGLLYICIFLLIVYLITSFINLLTNKIMVKISENILYRIRKDLFIKLENLSIDFFDKNKIGDIMSIFTNDITLIGDAISDSLIGIINSIITLVGVTIIIFVINVPMAIATIVTVPLLFVAVMIIGKKSSEYFDIQQNKMGKISSYSEEITSGMKTIKGLNAEENFIYKFNHENDNLKNSTIKANTYGNMLIPINSAITNVGNILLIIVGSILVIKGNIKVGDILAYLSYASMFRSPINNLASLFSSINEALAGAKRVFKIIDTQISVKDKNKIENLEEELKEISFNHVYFSYNDKTNILKDINLNIKKGENIAVVGPTGAGKSTIINLIMRFYDVNEGSIKINNIDIKDMKQSNLRKKIGIVLQDNFLFKGTVLDNIKYGLKDVDMNKIIETSKKTGAYEFIHRLPDGYYTKVEENGDNFSSGEKQLIAITRVMLYNPELLILDEATSDIDTKTELLVQKGIKELMKNRTSIIIAHRLSTIIESDNIIFVDKGKIVEIGNHKDLINLKGKYYKLYQSQFN